MDEIDLMHEIAASVPPRDDEARARARARLQARIADEARPVPDVSKPKPSHPARLVAAASIAAIVIAVLVLQAILPPDRGGPSTAQATLNDLAVVAAGLDAIELRAGQYLYVKTAAVLTQSGTDVSIGRSWTVTVPVTREKWLAADGSGRVLERYGQPRFSSSEDRQAWLEAGRPPLLPHGSSYDSSFGPGELAPRDLGAIPRDLDSLADLIASGGGLGSAALATNNPLDTAAELLSEVPATSELRSAVFNATARIPGITTRFEVRDSLGRIGVAISLVRAGVGTELLFDPKTSALLEKIVTQLDRSGDPTQVLERSTYLERSVVESAQTRP